MYKGRVGQKKNFGVNWVEEECGEQSKDLRTGQAPGCSTCCLQVAVPQHSVQPSSVHLSPLTP